MAATGYWQRRRSRRRVLASAAAGGAALALLGCSTTAKSGQSGQSGAVSTPAGSGSAQGTPQQGGTLNVYSNSNYPLDPQKVSAGAQPVVSGVYSRLFDFKTGSTTADFLDHNVVPDLGMSAESPDGITWTVKLRPDAVFANIPPVNGHAVEAEDVKSTYTRILAPATSSPNRGQLGMIDPTQIQTPDKTTVVFKLAFPYAPFNKSLASPAYSLILPREALAGSYDPTKVVIGSGPFTLDSATPDVAYTYKKSPTYYNKSQVYLDGYRYAVVPDPNTQLAQFTTGNLDELVLSDATSLGAAQKQNPKATTLRADAAPPMPIFWQLGDPTLPFVDIRVRQAFNMAVDRDALSKSLFSGQSQSVVFVPAYMGKWSMLISDLPADTQQYYKYNPADAKKLMQAAGINSLQLTFVNVRQFGPLYEAHGEAIRNMLSAIGVTTSSTTIDYNTDYVDNGHGSSQGFYPKDWIIDGSFSSYTDADEWLFAYWDSKSVNSHENVKDPKIDAMIDKERSSLDDATRVSVVKDLQTYVAQQVLYMPTLGSYQWILLQPRVHNYQYSSSLGKPSETWAKVWLSA